MTLNFSSPTQSIKNYELSKLAKSETKDCVVRALAAACDWDYDKSHRFVEKEFGRQPKKGTPNFITTINRFMNEGKKLGRKKIKAIDIKDTKTVGQLVKWYDKGTYLIVISRHAFTIKDGIVVGGNREDATRMRCQLKAVWKIG